MKNTNIQKKSTIKLSFEMMPELRKSEAPSIPTFKRWIKEVLQEPSLKLKEKNLSLQITIALVTKKESARLNKKFRQKSGPTNILTFRDASLVKLGLPIFGDLIICLPAAQKEAREQNKNLRNHLAHLVVHGLLHLFEYDHITGKESAIMEKLEIKILRKLKIANPYIQMI